jgi:hypothetical protein
MKGPLYQLLQSSDILPMVFEDIQGMITKSGAWGDGYCTLYEIMSRIHPILNPGVKLPPPHSRSRALDSSSTNPSYYYNIMYQLKNSNAWCDNIQPAWLFFGFYTDCTPYGGTFLGIR